MKIQHTLGCLATVVLGLAVSSAHSAGIAVNGKLLPQTAPLDHDSEGRPLTHWPSGRYIAVPETLWVASSYNSRSYDSRYFGPIRESAVRARLRPLIGW